MPTDLTMCGDASKGCPIRAQCFRFTVEPSPSSIYQPWGNYFEGVLDFDPATGQHTHPSHQGADGVFVCSNFLSATLIGATDETN